MFRGYMNLYIPGSAGWFDGIWWGFLPHLGGKKQVI